MAMLRGTGKLRSYARSPNQNNAPAYRSISKQVIAI